jgi:predicted kinase
LIVFAGLPGVGKSTLAREVARELGAAWLRVDTIEASVLKAGIAPSFETGLAAYLVACDVAEARLLLGGDVLIDAVNGVEPARRMWRELAERCGARRLVVEVTCPDPLEHRRRVESRTAATPPLPAPTWEEVVAREYRPWEEPVLSLDGTRPVPENLPRVLAYCSSSPAAADRGKLRASGP